jgi:hypothetical protein
MELVIVLVKENGVNEAAFLIFSCQESSMTGEGQQLIVSVTKWSKAILGPIILAQWLQSADFLRVYAPRMLFQLWQAEVSESPSLACIPRIIALWINVPSCHSRVSCRMPSLG